MKKPKKEKWRVIPLCGDKQRAVVDQDNVLIADCYADAFEAIGIPEEAEYKRNAKRIAMLPELVSVLEVAELWISKHNSISCGSLLHSKIAKLLGRYKKLKSDDS